MAVTGITIDDIALRHGQVQVFDGLTLRLTERRIAIIGRNGAGKSQLMRLIGGLIAPDAGAVRVCGQDLAHDRKAAISTIGLLFQNPDHQIIFPTVGEELAFGLHQQGVDKAQAAQQVQDILTTFDRPDWAPRAIHGLSQGQRHLVCLMAVLLMNPAVIVLDEPFAGLDLATKLRLTRYLDALPQQLIHITHELDTVMGYDRAIWLERGALRQDGAPQQVIPVYRAAMQALGQDDAFTNL